MEMHQSSFSFMVIREPSPSATSPLMAINNAPIPEKTISALAGLAKTASSALLCFDFTMANRNFLGNKLQALFDSAASLS